MKHLCISLLMASMAISSALAAEPTPSLVVKTYSVLRGDTLDRIIQKTMPGSPLRADLLRKAFVDLNPAAFVAGNPARLQTGAQLQLPDQVQLLRTTLLPLLEGAEAAGSPGDSRQGNASERRSWVRFP